MTGGWKARHTLYSDAMICLGCMWDEAVLLLPLPVIRHSTLERIVSSVCV